MFKSFLFIVNPVSGGIDKENLISQINSFCKNGPRTGEIYYTSGENDLRRIEDKIKEYNPEVVVVAGGDGTVNLVTPLLLRFKLTLGVIPAGSANGLASEFGIFLDNAFDVLASGAKSLLDIVLLNDEQYMLHLADFGLNAMLVRRYEEEDRRGFLGYAISAIQELGSLKDEFQVKIESDKGDYSFNTRLLVIANAREYGTGFQVNPLGQHGDGKVELCILKEISPELILKQLLEDASEEENNNFFEIISVSEAQIKCGRGVDFQSDGEYWDELDQVSVSVMDNPIEILTPKQSSI